MSWSNEERQGFMSTLDGVDRIVVAFYRVFLSLIIAGILAVVAVVIVKRPWGAGNQGEWFYFSIAVLAALGWAIGQFISLGRRQRNRRARAANHSSNAPGVWTWQFRIGTPIDDAHQHPDADRAE